MIENGNIQQVPKELEERLEMIREMIQTDMAEYGHMPSLRDFASEFNISVEEAAECAIYLPVDEFCDFISFLSQYEWDIISQISEMKHRASEMYEEEDDDDEEDYQLMESFHFMT